MESPVCSTIPLVRRFSLTSYVGNRIWRLPNVVSIYVTIWWWRAFIDLSDTVHLRSRCPGVSVCCSNYSHRTEAETCRSEFIPSRFIIFNSVGTQAVLTWGLSRFSQSLQRPSPHRLCLLSTSAAIPAPPSSNWGRAMPWRKMIRYQKIYVLLLRR
jgi:hypothetical protein